MRVTAAKLGGHFGNLAKMRGIVTYKLSPYEQKAFPNFIASLGKVARRIASNVPYVAPPFVVSYLIYTEVEKKSEQMSRKNPADYVNDK